MALFSQHHNSETFAQRSVLSLNSLYVITAPLYGAQRDQLICCTSWPICERLIIPRRRGSLQIPTKLSRSAILYERILLLTVPDVTRMACAKLSPGCSLSNENPPFLTRVIDGNASISRILKAEKLQVSFWQCLLLIRTSNWECWEFFSIQEKMLEGAIC